jgi:hypothetical protein
MAKRVTANFNGELRKNNVRGGGWIAEYSVTRADLDKPVAANYSAWANPSAGKKWLKEMVLAHTPKKSIKMVAGTDKDDKGKPIYFNGDVPFKVDLV